MPNERETLPTMSAIIAYWMTADRVPTARLAYIGDGEPFCFRCGWLAPASDHTSVRSAWSSANRYLDRAHLVDRASGG